MLEQQPAAGRQMRGCVSDDAADRIKAIVAAGKRRRRFEAQVAALQVRVVCRDVGRIARDQIESLAMQGREPVAVSKRDVPDAVAPGILLRHGERRGTGIGRDDRRHRPFTRQCQRDRTAAGAKIGDADGAFRRQSLQGRFHQSFGVRPRDQGVGGDAQAQAPEAPFADQMRHRHAAHTRFDQGIETFDVRRINGIVRMREQPGTLAAERMQEQQLRFAPRLVAGETRLPPSQKIDDGTQFCRGWRFGHDGRMVAEPSELPHAPVRDAAAAERLIEASFRLWHRSWKQSFLFAMAYGIASLLPAFALQGVLSDTLLRAVAVFATDLLPALPLPAVLDRDPVALFEPLLARLRDPLPWLLSIASLLLMVASTTAMLVRQAGIARDHDAGAAAALSRGLRRTPATALAWLLYTAIALITALPFFALLLGCLLFGMDAGITGLLVMMIVVLLGGLLSSVPLAWASVAFGFSPVVTALEPVGPVAAQMRSMRLVRGHWWRCAVVVSMPLLIYIGAGGTVSSLLMLACGAIAVTLNGWAGLFDPAWLLWSQVLALPLQAVLLPLASAGFVTMFDALRAMRSSAAN